MLVVQPPVMVQQNRRVGVYLIRQIGQHAGCDSDCERFVQVKSLGSVGVW